MAEHDHQDNYDLKRSDIKEIERRTAIGAIIVLESVREEGEEELKRHPLALMWSGLAAGLSMGFSFLCTALLDTYMPDVSWKTLISSFGYSIGFVIVVLGRQQLFTENTLTAILPLLNSRRLSTLMSILRLWGIVLAANLMGILAFVLLLGPFSGAFDNVETSLGHLAPLALASPFWVTVLKGVMAGWLIALMVWLLPAAENTRLWVVLLITYFIGLGGYSHVIAGSADALYASIWGTASAYDYFIRFLFPALIGNVLGGVILVAILNYLQVSTGRDKS